MRAHRQLSSHHRYHQRRRKAAQSTTLHRMEGIELSAQQGVAYKAPQCLRWITERWITERLNRWNSLQIIRINLDFEMFKISLKCIKYYFPKKFCLSLFYYYYYYCCCYNNHQYSQHLVGAYGKAENKMTKKMNKQNSLSFY